MIPSKIVLGGRVRRDCSYILAWRSPSPPWAILDILKPELISTQPAILKLLTALSEYNATIDGRVLLLLCDIIRHKTLKYMLLGVPDLILQAYDVQIFSRFQMEVLLLSDYSMVSHGCIEQVLMSKHGMHDLVCIGVVLLMICSYISCIDEFLQNHITPSLDSNTYILIYHFG